MWGWVNISMDLFPIKIKNGAAPDSILQSTSQLEKKECLKACGCQIEELNCTNVYKHWNGQSCTNTPDLFLASDVEEKDDLARDYMFRDDNYKDAENLSHNIINIDTIVKNADENPAIEAMSLLNAKNWKWHKHYKHYVKKIINYV